MATILETFSFFFWNCASGIKSKFDYVKNLVQINDPMVFFICESEIKEQDLTILKISGYDLKVAKTINGEFKKSRIACYIKTHINYQIINLRNNTQDIVAIDVGKNRFVGVYKGFKLPKNETQTTQFHEMLRILKKT